MSILDPKSKGILVECMRKSLCGVLQESTTMTAAEASQRMKYVNENATYEQLLNITMNPDRDTNYLPDHVLEGAVAILHSACMTGRQYIGVNAITEGAIKLEKATGCVITESMLDAALNAVEHGKGLQLIGAIMEGANSIITKQVNDMGGYEAFSKAIKSNPHLKEKMEKSTGKSADQILASAKKINVTGTQHQIDKLKATKAAAKAAKKAAKGVGGPGGIAKKQAAEKAKKAYEKQTEVVKGRIGDKVQNYLGKGNKGANPAAVKNGLGKGSKVALGVAAAGAAAYGGKKLYDKWRNKKAAAK